MVHHQLIIAHLHISQCITTLEINKTGFSTFFLKTISEVAGTMMIRSEFHFDQIEHLWGGGEVVVLGKQTS